MRLNKQFSISSSHSRPVLAILTIMREKIKSNEVKQFLTSRTNKNIAEREGFVESLQLVVSQMAEVCPRSLSSVFAWVLIGKLFCFSQTLCTLIWSLSDNLLMKIASRGIDCNADSTHCQRRGPMFDVILIQSLFLLSTFTRRRFIRWIIIGNTLRCVVSLQDISLWLTVSDFYSYGFTFSQARRKWTSQVFCRDLFSLPVSLQLNCTILTRFNHDEAISTWKTLQSCSNWNLIRLCRARTYGERLPCQNTHNCRGVDEVPEVHSTRKPLDSTHVDSAHISRFRFSCNIVLMTFNPSSRIGQASSKQHVATAR